MQHYIWTQDDSQPRFRHEKWRQVFDDQIKSTPFTLTFSADPLFSLPLAEHVEGWEVWLPKSKIWERLTTLSQISVLDEGEKEVSFHVDLLLGCEITSVLGSLADELLQKVKKMFLDAVDADDVEKNDNGEVAIHGSTYTYWTTKVPA